MYGIFTNIYPKNHPHVGKYTIHGAYGLEQNHGDFPSFVFHFFYRKMRQEMVNILVLGTDSLLLGTAWNPWIFFRGI